MISLLTNFQMKEYDVLTIQEFWRNVCVSTLYNSHTNNFHLTYDEKNNVHVCLYVNIKINVDDWTMIFYSSNVCSIKLKIKNNNKIRFINIHNVYNAFFNFYVLNAFLLVVFIVNSLLFVDDEHVLFDDFNFHHLFWSESIRSTQHNAANQFIDIMQDHD
jgi:hypothetical protein